MKVLGIYDGHNCSAALMIDGKIVAAVQEERLSRRKNEAGFPKRAIEDVLSIAGIRKEEIDIIAMAGTTMPARVRGKDLIKAYYARGTRWGRVKVWFRDSPLFPFYRSLRSSRLEQERMRNIAECGLDTTKVEYYDHHLCHAAAAYYGSHFANNNKPILCLTCDGGGDGLVGSVNICQGLDIERIATIPDGHSLGNIYALVTFILGMMPWEHEYKLMGLAPYANREAGMKVYHKIKHLLEFPDEFSITWRRGKNVPPTFGLLSTLEKLLRFERFDSICFGLQYFTEQLLTDWVKRCVCSTGIHRVALSGGVFMNVKANKAIMELEEVEDMFVFPSCGDETNAIGACYLAYVKHAKKMPAPIGDLYLGRGFTAEEIEDALRKFKFESRVDVSEPQNIESCIADLLAKGEIVARFDGRMEFGARALGNRSILANPSDIRVVRAINEMIKSRDFWMPFAPSLLQDFSGKYLVNPKNIKAPYMILAFDTYPESVHEIEAAVHPYDRTCRPQVVSRDWNPSYYRILTEFYERTGIGGLLNTSFNLHGYPIVYSPIDALEVFKASGLKYLALGPFMLKKKD